jgi:ribonuclease D
VLQNITRWREEQARDRDRPRGRVLKDRSCFEIARLRPRDIKNLAAIDEIGAKTVRNNGDELLSLIKQAEELSKDELPVDLPKPLPPASNGLLKHLKAHIRHRSEQLNIAPEFLVKKRDFEELLRSGHSHGVYQLPESLSGWREKVVGEGLMDTVRRKGE